VPSTQTHPITGDLHFSALGALSPVSASALLQSPSGNCGIGVAQVSPASKLPDTPTASAISSSSRSRVLSRAAELAVTEHNDVDRTTSGFDAADLRRILFLRERTGRDTLITTSGVPSLTSDADLSLATVHYVRRFIHQLLDRAEIPDTHAWEDHLIRLLIKVARYLRPNVRTGGDLMDVRNYIHIKKIPGGRPHDSEYIDGVVCTKNVLHKKMSRFLPNPRIMLLSFPLEYHRVENQFMSLEPLVNQEREYLRNLVARVVAQRPHIVLVERNVSRLALEYLLEAKVAAVARFVKPSVLQAIARCTQAVIISSMDKLALEPRLGRCGLFRIQTFDHVLIPGRRKSYMRFESCSCELGATIVLRGGDTGTLAKLKKIVDFMVLAVFSIRLEHCFLRDEHVLPSISGCSGELEGDADTDEPVHDSAMAKTLTAVLHRYRSTLLSVSPTVQFPPPFHIFRMRQDDLELCKLRRRRDNEDALEILREDRLAFRSASSSSIFSAASETTASAGKGMPPSATNLMSSFVLPSGIGRSLSEHPLTSVQFTLAEKTGASAAAVKLAEGQTRTNQVADAEDRYADHRKVRRPYMSY